MTQLGYSKGSGPDRFGSAHFMSMDEKNKYFLDYSQGIHLGGNWIFSDQGHVMVVGGSRAGKGTKILMQNLLGTVYKGSMIVIDPKGEYAAMTARYRQELGNNVHIIDPWGLQDNPRITHGITSSRYNPLDILEANSPNLPDDCDLIADLIVPRDHNDRDPHFSDKARQMISAYLLQMVSFLPEEEITLYKLRSLFRQSLDNTLKWLDTMRNNFEDDLHGEVIRDNGNELYDFLEQGEREAASVFSTAQRVTDIFKSNALRQATRQSDFDMKQITEQFEIIYICIPPDRLGTHFPWLRLMVGNIITIVQRHHNGRVMMMLEEFHTLGRMKIIESSLALMAGYNLQLIPVVQDLNQLKRSYGDAWESFIANTAAQCFLGIEDLFTAEYVSRKLGNTTGYHSKRDKNDNLIEEHWQRPLLTPDEVMSTPNIVVFNKLGRPFWTSSSAYYQNKLFRGCYDPNPYLDTKIPQTFEEQWADASARAEPLKDKGVMDFPEYGFSIRKRNGKLDEIDLRLPKSNQKKYPGLLKGGGIGLLMVAFVLFVINMAWDPELPFLGIFVFVLLGIPVGVIILPSCYHYMRYEKWLHRS